MKSKAKIVAHKSECNDVVLYPNGGGELRIKGDYIKNFAKECRYSDCLMPVSYMILDVDIDLYDNIINDAADGEVYVNIRNYNAKESNAIHKDMIKDKFIYFVPSKFNKAVEFDSKSANRKSHFKHLVLGLMKPDQIDRNKTAFNGIWEETATEDLVGMVLESLDTEVKMDELEINTDYETFIMPPVSSVAEAIDYLFNKEPFFETDYQFFMDYDSAYLLNSTGSKRDFSSMPTVSIMVQDIQTKAAYYEGCVRDGDSGSYIIYVNETDINFKMNTMTEKNTNQLVGLQTDEVTKTDVNISSNQVNDNRIAFVSDSGKTSTEIKKNILENTAITMDIVKKNMDASIVTPDKCYVINYPAYKDYNGIYLLQTKTEILAKSGYSYDTTTQMSFVRIAAQDGEEE